MSVREKRFSSVIGFMNFEGKFVRSFILQVIKESNVKQAEIGGDSDSLFCTITHCILLNPVITKYTFDI